MHQKLFSNNSIISDIKNPFENDYSGNLKGVACGYTRLFEQEAKTQPLVASLDANWGLGKTVMLDMWGQWLLNEEKVAVKFDAWRSDYSNDALSEIISQLYTQLEVLGLAPKTRRKLKEVSMKLIKAFAPEMIKLSINSALALTKLSKPVEKFCENMGNEAALVIKSGIEDDIKKYKDKNKSLNDFKSLLIEIAKNKTLFIFIDEIDRCKPSFSLAVLEIIKHFFDVPGVCIVIATSMKSLEFSVKHAYGYTDLMAKEYLERFIDIPVILPEPDKNKFIDFKFLRIDSLLNPAIRGDVRKSIELCSRNDCFSLRVIEKYLRDIRLFIEWNNAKGSEVPDIYYPAVAVILGKNRATDSGVVEKIRKKVDSDVKLNWLCRILEASDEHSQLNNVINQLKDEIRHRSAKSPRNPSEQEDLVGLQGIYGKIVNEVYGISTSPLSNFIGGLPSDKITVTNYINHHSIVMRHFHLLTPVIIDDKANYAVA